MASWNLTQYIAEIHSRGVQSANRFVVEITPPKGLALSSDQSRMLTLRCTSSEFPGMETLTDDSLRYGVGPSDSIAVGANFNTVPCAFVVDNAGKVTDIFYNWQKIMLNADSSQGMGSSSSASGGSGTGLLDSLINDAESAIFGSTASSTGSTDFSSWNPYEVGYKDNYATTVTIKQMSLDGLVMKTCVLNKAFPKSVGAVQVSHGLTDSYNVLPVNFIYRDHRVF